MKRYNKFYNVSLGNFLKVACCSLSIITIASCEEEPFEEQEINSKSDLQKAASDFRAALKNSGSDVSIAYLDDIENLDIQKAQNLCKNLEEIQGNETITDEVKSLAARLRSQCKKFFGFKKEENKLTDDNPSQKEQKLDRTEEWKKVEEAAQKLITKYKNLGKSDYDCSYLNSFKKMGKIFCDDDSDGELSNLKFILKDLDSEKKDFADNAEVITLINNVKSVIKDFFNKFDKSKPAGDSPSQKEQKLNKTEEWKKVEEAAQKLINKFQSMGMSDNFWNPLNSMLEVGNRLCANDSDEKLDNLKRALQTFVTYKNEQQFQKNKEVIDLIDKVESAVNDFINQFYKSEPAGDSIVSK